MISVSSTPAPQPRSLRGRAAVALSNNWPRCWLHPPVTGAAPDDCGQYGTSFGRLFVSAAIPRGLRWDGECGRRWAGFSYLTADWLRRGALAWIVGSSSLNKTSFNELAGIQSPEDVLCAEKTAIKGELRRQSAITAVIRSLSRSLRLRRRRCVKN